MIINRVDALRTVRLQGITGQLNLQKIDNTITWETPLVQIDVVDSTQPLTLNGYTVMLLILNNG